MNAGAVRNKEQANHHEELLNNANQINITLKQQQEQLRNSYFELKKQIDQ
jgi:hypothetical protein